MKLLFLPVDIELPDNLQQVDFNNNNKSRSLSKYNPYWSSSPLTFETNKSSQLHFIIDQLPFVNLTTITHKVQEREVGPHYDVYPDMTFQEGEQSQILKNEPCGYRILIVGNDDSLEVFDGARWITPVLPSVPCCYVLNSVKAKHRVKHDDLRRLIYFRGFVDPIKHRALLAKSWNKFSQCAIFHT